MCRHPPPQPAGAAPLRAHLRAIGLAAGCVPLSVRFACSRQHGLGPLRGAASRLAPQQQLGRIIQRRPPMDTLSLPGLLLVQALSLLRGQRHVGAGQGILEGEAGEGPLHKRTTGRAAYLCCRGRCMSCGSTLARAPASCSQLQPAHHSVPQRLGQRDMQQWKRSANQISSPVPPSRRILGARPAPRGEWLAGHPPPRRAHCGAGPSPACCTAGGAPSPGLHWLSGYCWGRAAPGSQRRSKGWALRAAGTRRRQRSHRPVRVQHRVVGQPFTRPQAQPAE